MDRPEYRVPATEDRDPDIFSADGRLHGLIGVAPNAYMMLRPDLVIVGCNDAYVAAVGRTRDTFVGQPLFEAFPADPHSESYRLLRHSIDRVLHTLETDHIAFIPYAVGEPAKCRPCAIGAPRTSRSWARTARCAISCNIPQTSPRC
jgi:PAS domain-containing protein